MEKGGQNEENKKADAKFIFSLCTSMYNEAIYLAKDIH